MLNVKYLLDGRNVNYALFDENDRLTKRIFRFLARYLFPSALIADPETFVKNVSDNIRRASDNGADYVIVFLHWGIAKHSFPSQSQRKLALRLCNIGADAIIGAGPHIIQPFEVVKVDSHKSNQKDKSNRECLIAYSLGDFISEHRGIRQYGMALELTIAKDQEDIYLQSVHPHIVRYQFHPPKVACNDNQRQDICAFGLHMSNLK